MPKDRPPKWPLPPEFDSIKVRLTLEADKLERRALTRQGYGAQGCLITRDHLLQHVATRHHEQRPPFDPTKQTRLKWAQRRMKDEYDRVMRRAENHYKSHTHFSSSQDPANKALVAVSLEAYREYQDSMHRRIDATKFLHWLGAHEPDFFRVAQLMILFHVTDKAELCRKLGLMEDECIRIVAGIKRAIPKYHKAIASKHGDR